MEMTREEAIQHLENMKWLKGYSNTTVDGVSLDKIIDDIIVLLEAQEPRVMTESELEGYISSLDGEARVWIEHKKLGLYCASLWSRNPSRGEQNFYDVMHECYFDRSEIGKWWRPWTSRPTDEQRKAVKWND